MKLIDKDKITKELLLKDLCARLPFNCRVFYEYVDDLDGRTYGYSLTLNTWCINELEANKAVIKPYLRPMSSMTEEEYKEYSKLWDLQDEFSTDADIRFKTDVIDWLNAHHFDYRGLIERGLAIAVTEENNPYKE
jgi:hypothetical protein